MQLNGKIHKFADDSYLFSDKHMSINNIDTIEELIDIEHIHKHLITNTKDNIINNKDNIINN